MTLCENAPGVENVYYYSQYINSATILFNSLCRLRLVLHGGIDGFSRLVVYLHCSTDNRASTGNYTFMIWSLGDGFLSSCWGGGEPVLFGGTSLHRMKHPTITLVMQHLQHTMHATQTRATLTTPETLASPVQLYIQHLPFNSLVMNTSSSKHTVSVSP